MDKVVHSKRPRKRGMKKNTTQEGCLLFFCWVRLFRFAFVDLCGRFILHARGY
jgi:hypothetical protein